MNQDQEPGITFHPVNSNIIAGNDINLSYQHTYQNVTVNTPEPPILTRLKTALNPVTSASYDSYEAKQRSECFPNTRVQVLNDIEAWLGGKSQQAPIYVLDGVAGIGKSTVAQTIAIRAAAVGLLGASFFFSREEDLRKVAKHFFPTIAYQLGCFDHHFATFIGQSLDQNPDAPAKRLHQQLSLLLINPLQGLLAQNSKPTLVVVDALDECEEENAEELLLLLGQYVHQMKGLKILITTRPESHLRKVLDQDRNHERFCLHEIEDSIVFSDIRLYLQSRLSEDEIRKASPNQQTPWQPTPKDMETLCGICGTLFIIASTAVRFILDSRFSPRRQLSRLLDGVSPSNFAGSKYNNALDHTYIRILCAAQSGHDGIDREWFRDLNKVLGALITLANPLSCEALASLLEMDPEDLESTLSRLHSLVAPTGSGPQMTFRIHHKSFPDFITDRSRIRQVLVDWKVTTQPDIDALLWIDTFAQHLWLAKACLRIMNRELKWNMGNINENDWYKDKDDIPHVVPQLISQELAYAALHWARHLRSAHAMVKDCELEKDLDTWASKWILAWMEVMVILDQVNDIYGILEDGIESMRHDGYMAWAERDGVQGLFVDAFRLVHQGSEVMRLSPMHIYRSCLPFIPTETLLYKTYSGMATLKVGLERPHQWNPLLALLIGHSGSVLSVAFSGDGAWLASGSADKTVRLWDAGTGAHIFTFTGHSGLVNSVAFSTDGSQLASGSNDRTIQLLDTRTGSQIFTLIGHSESVLSVAFSSDSSHLASGSQDKSIRLWNAKTGAHISTFTGHSDWVNSVAFLNSASHLASGSYDNTIRIWKVETGVHTSIFTGHSDWLNCIAFSSASSLLASGSDDGTIRLWNAMTGAHISTITGHSDWVNSMAFSGDGSQLVSGSRDKTIRIWDIRTGRQISILTNHLSLVNSVAFLANGSRLASGCNDLAIQIWDLNAGGHISPITAHSQPVNSVAFAKDDDRLASASRDKTIRVWDLSGGASCVSIFGGGHSQGVTSVTFSGDELACGSDDKKVQLWDAKTGEFHRTLYYSNPVGVNSVKFSSDGSQLAVAASELLLHDTVTKIDKSLSSLSVPSSTVLSIAFSTDGSQLASGSMDNSIRIWDAKIGAHRSTLTGHLDLVTSVAFSNDGSRLASGSYDNTIRLWDSKTGAHISTTTPSPNSSIMSLTILRDDSQIVDHTISPKSRMLQYQSAKPVYVLLLVKRENPPVTGLILAISSSPQEGKVVWEFAPVCWIPPDMEAASFAVSHSNSQVAIGCESGRVLLLDFSSDFPPPPTILS